MTAKKPQLAKSRVRRVRLLGARWHWLAIVPSSEQHVSIFATFPTHAEAVTYAHKHAAERNPS